MTDKERILQYIAGELVRANLDFGSGVRNSNRVQIDWSSEGKAKKGDVVYCVTSAFQNHDWSISFFQEYRSSYEFVLREIGSNRLCNMGNESLYVIRGLEPTSLLENDKYLLLQKIKKVFKRYGDDWHLPGGWYFDDEKEEVVLTIRERYQGSGLSDKVIDGKKFGTIPYEIIIPTPKWGKKLSMKKIAEVMKAQGWCIREFPMVERA